MSWEALKGEARELGADVRAVLDHGASVRDRVVRVVEGLDALLPATSWDHVYGALFEDWRRRNAPK